MITDIDVHVGKRIRRRRRLLGLTQQQLATRIGVRFQQVQKYECGANRVTVSRLYSLGEALNVNANFFFEGYIAREPQVAANDDVDPLAGDIFSKTETLELVRAYYKLGERPRRHLLDLAKALQASEAIAS